MWKFKKILQNNKWIKEKITIEIREYLKNKMKHTKWKLWSADKSVLREIYAVNACGKKKR